MKQLTSIADLDAVLADGRPVLLFKHSTQCPISTFADQEYARFAEQLEPSTTILLTHLDLIAHRDVSAAIAEKTGITHQSPQAILVVDGTAVWDASHTGITADRLAEAVAANL